MKTLPLIFVFYLFTLINLSAQNCTQESLLKTPGKWTEGMKGSTGSTSATDLVKEKIMIGNIHKALQHNYKPMGVDADYNGIYYNSASQYRWGNLYGYALRLMPYTCTNNSIGKAHETSTSLYISANNMVFGPEIYEPFIDSSPWDMGFRAISKIPVKKGNYYVYTEETGLGFGIRGLQSTWLITYDNKLPFLWVSRKEFLERRKQKLTEGRAQEAFQVKESYKTDEKIQKEKLALATKGYDIALAKVETDLKMSASELNEQAIVKQDPATVMSHLFTNANDPFAQILIKYNPDYFDKKLPRTSPQFFCIVLKGNDKDLILGNAMKELEKALDFDLLKALVGK